MKAFVASMFLLLVISVAAWLMLDSFKESSSEAFHIEDNVRL